MKKRTIILLLACFCSGMASGSDWQRNGENLLCNFNNMYNPCVVETGGEYRFKMWFFGWATSTGNPDVPGYDAIFLARSKDLKTWEVHCKDGSWDTAMNPAKWFPVLHADERWYGTCHIGDPSVVLKDGRYYMAYSSTSDPFAEAVEGYPVQMAQCVMGAVSDDGIHWSKSDQPLLIRAEDRLPPEPAPGRIGDFHRPCLRWENNHWRLWFDYWLPGEGVCMGYAENEGDFLKSAGFKIKHDLKKPVLANWPNPEIIRIGDTYHAFGDPAGYTVKEGQSHWMERQLCEAVSPDGLNWKRLDFIPPDEDTDASHVPQALVAEIDGKEWLYLFYATQSGYRKNDGKYHYQYDRIRAMRRPVNAGKPNIIVIFTDDQGYADVGVHGQVTDIKTPNLDSLARDGVVCTSGYITAPQCSPSRAGLLTGKYQQRFGFDHIPNGPLRLEETTIAERLKAAGYATGMVGKWHLEPNRLCVEWAREVCPEAITNNQVKVPGELVMRYFPDDHGFDEYFKGELNWYFANYGLDGKDLKPSGEWMDVPGYRLDIQTDAALAFIARNKEEPFFLYLAYFAPHVPLEATDKYLSRFPRSTDLGQARSTDSGQARSTDSGQAGEMPERRHHALAMMSAIDDGVGRIRNTLEKYGLDKNTIIFYISDNGAPLAMRKRDGQPIDPVGGPWWDGSLNTPWVGEKGMLMEGGIRVPYLVSWPARLPEGKTCAEPIISLDVAATCLAAAGQPIPAELDGVDLVPLLAGGKTPARALYWRFWQQAAIRQGKWKYLYLSDGRECLYDLESDRHEKDNLIARHPEKAKELRGALAEWADGLEPEGLPSDPVNEQEKLWYEHYLNPWQ